MNLPLRTMLLACAALVCAPAGAAAQSSPMPTLTPAPGATSPGMTGTPVTAAPEPSTAPVQTSAPAPAPAATSQPRSSLPGARNTKVGGAIPSGAKVKPIKNGSLSVSQVVYGMTHQLAAAKQLAQMKTINFNNLRVYKLPTSLKSRFKLSDADRERIAAALFGEVLVAQTTPTVNGNNSPIQYLRDVLANINVSNALNNLNVLNNSNVNVNVALSNVLNNNKISIGQVVGLYIGGGGIITTITS